MSNLDKSKTLVAEILARLELNGVMPARLHVSNFRPDYSPDEAALFAATMRWLRDEGVVRIGDELPDTDDDTLHYSSVLTSFGFRALEQRVSGNLTLRDQLNEARNNTRKWSNVGDLIGGVLGGFTKTIGNG